MRFSVLDDWLSWIKSIHPTNMDLSLERVRIVADRLNLLQTTCPIVTVGGTNGKGSCVAGLEAIYLAQGYRVGAFTTPMLFRHNEQVRVQGQSASDQDFCEAYQRIDEARDDITLTLFEFNTLAAFEIFHRAGLDVWLLEVGLGGRWDAVNVLDADVAVITSIGIDHTEWLGNTREAIAIEKAGIFRKNQLAVCGDFSPPETLIQAAHDLSVSLFKQGKEFGFAEGNDYWHFWSSCSESRRNLPKPPLALQNMATVLMTVELLQPRLPVSPKAIDQAMGTVKLRGRIEVIPGEVTQVFDVSHNPASAALLAEWLRKNKIPGKTRAVFSMLIDKEIVETINVIKEFIDEWFVAPISGERAAPLELLQSAFQKTTIAEKNFFPVLVEANQSAQTVSKTGDRVIVFGSFRTVAEVANHV